MEKLDMQVFKHENGPFDYRRIFSHTFLFFKTRRLAVLTLAFSRKKILGASFVFFQCQHIYTTKSQSETKKYIRFLKPKGQLCLVLLA